MKRGKKGRFLPKQKEGLVDKPVGEGEVEYEESEESDDDADSVPLDESDEHQSPEEFKRQLADEDGEAKRFYRLHREKGAIHMITIYVKDGIIIHTHKSEEDILDIQHDKISRLVLADMLQG